MESPWYRQLFPGTQLQRSAELELETTRKGMRYATSVGGTLTGLGAGLIIIDDPLKPQDAFSKTKREAVKQWYDTTLYSRLDNKATDVIIVVMQRLHVDDLVAHVLEKEPWVHLGSAGHRGSGSDLYAHRWTGGGPCLPGPCCIRSANRRRC